MAASALSHSRDRMGDDVRRFKIKLGYEEGIVAGAHKLARIRGAMIVTGQPSGGTKAFRTAAAGSTVNLPAASALLQSSGGLLFILPPADCLPRVQNWLPLC
jgi:hypothetical protein